MSDSRPTPKLSRRHFLTGAGAALGVSALAACRLGGVLSALATATPLPTFVSTSIGPSRTATRTPGVSPSSTRGPSATTSPTGQPTLAPTATAGPSSTLTPAPSQTPTSAPGTPPTATPTHTPTPTPTPTPYPPGPPTKLGIFTTRSDPQINTLIQVGKPALVKTLNLDPNLGRFIKENSPTTIVVGRIPLDQIDLTADPIPLAREAASALLEYALEGTRYRYFDAWEAYNEPVADTVEKMQRLADFEAERTRLLGEQGVRSVIGNFAAGHPPLELWQHFVPALDAVRQYDGYLGVHEYSAPVMQWGFGALQSTAGVDEGDEGWLTLRYRKSYRYHLGPLGFGTMPLLITECGVDGTVQPRPGPADAMGWQDFEMFWLSNGLRSDIPGVYMDQLIWYDSELQKDDYVKGSAIFSAGGSPGWESYELIGRTLELLTQYMHVHPPK